MRLSSCFRILTIGKQYIRQPRNKTNINRYYKTATVAVEETARRKRNADGIDLNPLLTVLKIRNL